jgi:hypothetical protein
VPPDQPDNGSDKDDSADARKEIYIEYKQVGQAMKVTAVDSETGMEVVIMGPASAAQTHLQKIAIQKLEMQLKKEAEKPEEIPPPVVPKKGWSA